jgi:hypothetical protein
MKQDTASVAEERTNARSYVSPSNLERSVRYSAVDNRRVLPLHASAFGFSLQDLERRRRRLAGHDQGDDRRRAPSSDDVEVGTWVQLPALAP